MSYVNVPKDKSAAFAQTRIAQSPRQSCPLSCVTLTYKPNRVLAFKQRWKPIRNIWIEEEYHHLHDRWNVSSATAKRAINYDKAQTCPIDSNLPSIAPYRTAAKKARHQQTAIRHHCYLFTILGRRRYCWWPWKQSACNHTINGNKCLSILRAQYCERTDTRAFHMFISPWAAQRRRHHGVVLLLYCLFCPIKFWTFYPLLIEYRSIERPCISDYHHWLQ